MKIRFGDEFEYTISIPSDMREYGIVKHTIQPIVENYIAHGFNPRKKENRIDIIGKKEGDDIEISIIDNGNGMSEDQLAEVRKRLRENSDPNNQNIGLLNVHSRLKIVYGANSGLTIESHPQVGTQVHVRFRAINTKELEDGIQDPSRR